MVNWELVSLIGLPIFKIFCKYFTLLDIPFSLIELVRHSSTTSLICVFSHFLGCDSNEQSSANSELYMRHYFSYKMGTERLLLFVRFCNVCGFFPSRMLLDDETKRFKRFDSHWRHPANWWFSFLLICQIVFSCTFLYVIWLALMAYEQQSLTIVQAAVFMLYQSNAQIMCTIPRLFILLRFRNIEEVLNSFTRMDRTLSKIKGSSCTTRRRTVIGIGISFIVVFKKISEMIFFSYNMVTL